MRRRDREYLLPPGEGQDEGILNHADILFYPRPLASLSPPLSRGERGQRQTISGLHKAETSHNLLQSIELLAASVRVLDNKAISGFTINEDNIKESLTRNPMLVTALNRVIGYEQGAAIAKRAYTERRTVLDNAEEMTDLGRADLDVLMDPAALTTNRN